MLSHVLCHGGKIMIPIKQEYQVTPKDLLGVVPSIETIHGVHKALKDKKIPSLKKGRRILIESSNIRKFFIERGFKYPSKNINFHVIKGGVGKSSIASAVAVRLNSYGAKVLCVDFDQQGNLTRSLGVDGRDKPVWLHLFRKDVNIQEAVIPITNTLHLIPSSMNNSRLDVEMTNNTVNIKDSVKDLLSPIRSDYDIVIFDCPPSLNKTTAAATCGSDVVIMPVNADGYSMDALSQTVDEIKHINDTFKTEVPFLILWNKYDQREKLSVKYLYELAEKSFSKGRILPVVIRVDASVKNALDQGISVFELKSKPEICDDFDSLTKEILGLNTWKESIH